ncbi:MAG: hypothetical protein ACLVJH_13445 [Faecalibacterium prausnitzii]
MFVVTLSKTSLKKLGAGAACCALVVFSAMLGRFISTRTVAVAAPVNRIERTGHPDMVHRLRAGGGRRVHHGG